MNHHFFNWINKSLANLFKPSKVTQAPARVMAQVVDLDDRQQLSLIYIKVTVSEAITKISLNSNSRTITIIVDKRLGTLRQGIYIPDVPHGVSLNAGQSIPVLMSNSKYNVMVTLTGASSELGFDVEVASANTEDLDVSVIPSYKYVGCNVYI